LELRKIKSIKQIRNIYKLYQNSFPKEEKKPFGLILIGVLRGNFEVFSIEKKKTDEKNRDSYEFKGLAIALKHEDLVLLDYLAITEEARSYGYGSKTLSFLKEYYKNYRFFLEIENAEDENAENYEERQSRKKFYLKNGFSPFPFNVDLFGIEMEILVYNCSCEFSEYLELYKNQFGGIMKKKISENIFLVEK